MLNKLISFFVICLFLFCFGCKTFAQQTVFNVPSADVTPKDALFIQHESQFQPWNPNPYWLGTQYNAFGIGHNTELDLTLFNVTAPASNNISLGTGFKTAMPIVWLKDKFPEREFKFTVGSEVLISMQGQGVGNWSYAHLSGRVPKLNTRLTAGASYGTKQVFFEQTVCFICAVEQPVTKKLSVIADWYSGNEHGMGYLICGISYKLPKDSTVYLGYQIPNSTQISGSGFVVEISKIFGLKANKGN